MTTCRGCGATVTLQFARVFGDREDRISKCPNCATYRDLKDGAFIRGEFE